MENSAIKNGVILGLLTVVLNLVVYFIDPRMLMSTWIGVGFFALAIYFVYRSGKETREEMGGYMSWGEALKPTFLTYVIYSSIAAAFTYVLYNFIDPSLIELQKEISIEAIEAMEGFIGEERMEMAIEEIENQDFSMSIDFAFSLVGGFVISAIVSAIVKKERPEGGMV